MMGTDYKKWDLSTLGAWIPKTVETEDGSMHSAWLVEMELPAEYPERKLVVSLNYKNIVVTLVQDSPTVLSLRCEDPTPARSGATELFEAGIRAIVVVDRCVGKIVKLNNIARTDWELAVYGRYAGSKYRGSVEAYDQTDLMKAAEHNDVETTKQLINSGAKIDDEDLLGMTALSYAAREGSWEAFQYLVEKGADYRKSDYWGMTLLHEAATAGSIDIVRWLVQKGVPVNSKSENFRTPLILAILGRHVEVAEYLVRQGAEVTTHSDQELKPLDMAREKFSDNHPLVRLLSSASGAGTE
jgi:Ankyrin repeats (3 copies)